MIQSHPKRNPMKMFRSILFVFMQLAVLSAICQKRNIGFEHLGTDKGLSQSNVLCILQDSRGFMWFGTRDGLNKYDGYTFTVYKNNEKDKHSISNNYIYHVVESANGDLWIATWGGGLNRFDRNRNIFITYKHDPSDPGSIASDFIRNVYEDHEGNVWVATEGAGLDILDKTSGKFIHNKHKESDKKSISDDYIRTVFEDRQQNIWIGTTNGGLNLYNRKEKTFSFFVHDNKDQNSLSSNDVYNIFEDAESRLWIGTNGGGLNLFDRSSGKFICYKNQLNNNNSLQSNAVYAINEDKNHKIWIGTENGGLSIFDPSVGVFDNYLHDEVDNISLSNNSIYAICKTTDNNMWIGTFNAGVDRVNMAAQFIHYKHSSQPTSLSDNHILSIYEDSKQNIWIGTDGGGLNLFDPASARFTHFLHDPRTQNSICGNYVLTVCEDYEHNIWIGTWGDGLTVYNPMKKTFRQFKNDPSISSSLSNNNVWEIYQDNEKNIWISTYGGGLNLFDPKTNSFSHYSYDETNKEGLNNNKIYSVLDDGKGHLWIGTDGGGINIFDKKTQKFTYYTHDDKRSSLVSNSIGRIYLDADSNFWIPTDQGLSFLNIKTKNFTNYTTRDGLPSNLIFGILQDKHHRLWISTGKGISCFDPATKIFKNYGVADGLQGDEFKEDAFCKTNTGALYFGGNNGFNVFFPDSLQQTSFDPPLVMTNFKIFNQQVPIALDDNDHSPLKKDITETNSLIISHKSSVIEFEFASLNFFNKKKEYSYMLEGFDETWTIVSDKRSATYTNLSPGTYTFKVKSMNNDGKWSSRILTLQLKITPPFWLTWWFKTLSLLFILGCLFAFYKMRLRAITKQKVQLEKQVKERTDEIELQKEELKKNVQELATLKENLEYEKYLLDSLMDNMPDSIYFKDKESKLLRVSKYMTERFCSTVDGLIGKTDFDFQNESHAKEAYEDEQNIQRTGKPKIDYVEKEIMQDGSEYWVLTSKLPLINARGEVIGTYGISRDITKIKLLEQSQHMAEMDKAVAQGKFEIASDVLHDIGNAIVGFGSYLTRIRRLQDNDKLENLQNLAGFFADQKTAMAAAIGDIKTDAVIKMLQGIAQAQRKNQEEINKTVTEQLNIITHVQEILNIQRQYINGQESQDRKPVNLRNIINDSIAMLFATIDKIGIAMSVNVSVEKPIIKGDRTKLMQLMLNVLKNSIEAIDKEAIEKNISINVYSRSDILEIQVSDTGNGFNKSTAVHLFERGFSTKSSGSGLGLHNSRSIVESHDGTIDLTSEGLGKGSLTTISFKTGGKEAAIIGQIRREINNN
jgi:PAS domain S-box-containing protein